MDGDSEAKVTTFARIESGKPGSISFYANPKYEKYVYSSKATIIIVNKSFEPKESVTATLVRVDDAYSAVAALLDYVTAERKKYSRHRGRHCHIAFSSKIGKKVYVGDCAFIGKKAKVGDFSKIYEQVYIGEGVEIGSRCIIYPGVKIYPGMKIGNNVVMGTATSLILAYADDKAISPETDTAIAMTTVELYLQSRGVGTCWAGYLRRMVNAIPEIRELLPEIPENHRIYGAFMVGYPEDEEYLHIPQRFRRADIKWT